MSQSAAPLTSGEEFPRPTGPRAAAGKRKARLARLVKSRTLKQRLLGGGFLLLLAAGWRYPLVGYFIPGCMLLGVGTALFRGRSWCNWLCPRGSFEDAWLARFSRGRAIPSAFRSTPLRVAVMAVLLGMLTWQLIRRWPDPYAIGAFFMLLLSLTTVAAVILGLFYHQRTWCYLCPIGTLSAWLGQNRQPLIVAAERCRGCDLCVSSCPMQLTPRFLAEQGGPARGDCLKCRLCVTSCPTSALTLGTGPCQDLAA